MAKKEFNMNNRSLSAGLVALALFSGTIAPVVANAQSSRDAESRHRQQKKNEWRNIGIGSAALGAVGLLKGNGTLTILGAAGALYSANRYEQDRKSQAKTDRARAAFYNEPYHYDHGHRYVRKTVWQNGHKYYKYVRG